MSTISASTTSTTAYKVVADTTGTLVLQTGSTPTTAATFDANQNMGLGVTPQTWQSTSKALQIGVTGAIRGRSDANLVNMMSNFYTDSAGTNKYIVADYATNYQQYQGTHAWYYAASGSAGGTASFTQAMTLDASGNLGVGTSSPAYKVEVKTSTAASIVDLLLLNNGGGSNGGGAGLRFEDAGAAARVAGVVFGPNENSGLGLGFYTSSSAGSAPTEKARIDSSGSFFVGTSTTWLSSAAYKQGGVQVGNANYAAIVGQAGGTARYGLFYDAANTYLTVTSGGTFYVYNTTNGVYLSANATSWTSNSDERLKDIIEPITNAASKVSSLRAVIGKYKTDEDGTRRSFLIGQDVQAVLPEAVTESQSKDQEQSYLGVQYTDVIPLLVAAIKEQQAIIETLTNRITALEAK